MENVDVVSLYGALTFKRSNSVCSVAELWGLKFRVERAVVLGPGGRGVLCDAAGLAVDV